MLIRQWRRQNIKHNKGDPKKFSKKFQKYILQPVISTSNHMFKREIWDKLSEYIFEKYNE